MSIASHREDDFYKTTFDYVTLRKLFFSFLNKSSKEDFQDLLSDVPRSLVTNGVFLKEFWPTVRSKMKSGLTAEQAWFGIRSIIKGSVSVQDYLRVNPPKKGKITMEMFEKTKTGKVDEDIFAYGFTDPQLQDLLTAYNNYETWKNGRKWVNREGERKKGWKDEIDLVIQAWKENQVPSLVKHATSEDQVLTHNLDAKEAERFRENARRFMQSWLQPGKILERGVAPKQRKDSTREQKDSVKAWIKRIERTQWPEGGPKVEQILFEKNFLFTVRSPSGTKYPIYKSRLPGGNNNWRVIWTCIRLDNSEISISIIGYSFDHKTSDPDISRASYSLSKEEITIDDANKIRQEFQISDQVVASSLNDEERSQPPTGNAFIGEIPGRGPPRSMTGLGQMYQGSDLTDHDGNIFLDDTQKAAIIDLQPLLIDGLPGTGKTSALSKRAALVAAMSSTKKRILVTCYSPSLLDRISRDVQFSIDNDFSRTEQEFLETQKPLINDHASEPIHYVFDSKASGDNKPTNSLNFSSEEFQNDEWGYNEILVDECQDLTQLEFEFLRKMAMREWLPTEGRAEEDQNPKLGGDPRRFTLAGDPLQTLEPTGFDWGRIKAFLSTDRMVINPIEYGKIDESRFFRNYRSVEEITTLANAVDLRRSHALPTKLKHRYMVSDLEASDPPVRPLIHVVKSKEEMDSMSHFYSDAARKNATILTWSQDDIEISRQLEEGIDPILNKSFERVNKKALKASEFASAGLLIHSQRSIKGLEFDTVILHSIFSNPEVQEKLSSLIQKPDESLDSPEDKQMRKALEDLKNRNYKNEEAEGAHLQAAFAFSRLYVSLTRGKRKIHLVENESGLQFIKEMTIGLESEKHGGIGIDLFDYKEERTSDVISTYPEFMPTHDDLMSSFELYRKHWMDEGRLSSLEWALKIAEENDFLTDASNGGVKDATYNDLKAQRFKTLAAQEEDSEARIDLMRSSSRAYADAIMYAQSASMAYLIYRETRNPDDLKECQRIFEGMKQATHSTKLFNYEVQIRLGESPPQDVDPFDILDPLPKADNSWTLEMIEASAKFLQGHLLEIIRESWPAHKDRLRSSGGNAFEDLSDLLNILGELSEDELIIELIEQKELDYPSHFIKSKLALSPSIDEPKNRQGELDKVLDRSKGFPEELLRNLKHEIIDCHLEIIKEVGKSPNSEISHRSIPPAALSFDAIYSAKDGNSESRNAKLKFASMIRISDLSESGDSKIPSRLYRWCRALSNVQTAGKEGHSTAMRHLQSALETPSADVDQSLDFINNNKLTAFLISRSFNALRPSQTNLTGDWSEDNISIMAKASKELDEPWIEELLNDTIPIANNYLPTKEKGQELRNQLIERFGDQVLNSLEAMDALNQTKQRAVVDFILQSKTFRTSNAEKWVNSGKLDSSGLKDKIREIRKKILENRNPEFIESYRSGKGKLDIKYTEVAEEYCKLIQDKESKALNARINRDVSSIISRIIDDGKEFRKTLDQCNSKLREYEEQDNYEWTEEQITSLVNKEDPESSDTFEFGKSLKGVSEWKIKVSEMSDQEQSELLRKILGQSTVTSIHNLCRIAPSIDVMIELLGMEDETELNQSAMPLNNWAKHLCQALQNYGIKRFTESRGSEQDKTQNAVQQITEAKATFETANMLGGSIKAAAIVILVCLCNNDSETLKHTAMRITGKSTAKSNMGDDRSSIISHYRESTDAFEVANKLHLYYKVLNPNKSQNIV